MTVTPLTDGNESVSTPSGTPISGNLLNNDVLPVGTTDVVTAFSVPGVSEPFTPGPTPVPMTDPVTGKPIGNITVLPDGTFTFSPAPGYTGPAPPITYTVTASDGQVDQSTLNISVGNSPPSPPSPPPSPPASFSPLLDGNEQLSTSPSTPVTTNLLSNSDNPLGTTESVASFTVAGSPTVYTPGPTPVTIIDPATGTTTGTLVLQPDGTAIFTPAPGYAGNVPEITYTVTSSDGQTNPSTLDITIGKESP